MPHKPAPFGSAPLPPTQPRAPLATLLNGSTPTWTWREKFAFIWVFATLIAVVVVAVAVPTTSSSWWDVYYAYWIWHGAPWFSICKCARSGWQLRHLDCLAASPRASLKGAAINYNYLVVLYVKLCLTCPPSWQAGRQTAQVEANWKPNSKNWHNQCARAAREVNLIYGSTLGRGLQRALEQWGINYRAAYDSFQFTIELKHFECLNEAKKRLKRNLKRKIRKLSKD